MIFLGDFWYDADSLLCLRAFWAIVHSGVKVRMRRRIPLLSTLYLWLRILFTSKRFARVLLPILVPHNLETTRPVRGSVSISRVADNARDRQKASRSLFPPQHIVDIDKFMRASDILHQYSLQLFVNACSDEPQTAAEFALPTIFRPSWIARPLLMILRNQLLAEYPTLPSRVDVQNALQALRKCITEGNRSYICADEFTYADICMATSMFFAVRREHGSAGHRLYNDSELATEFEDLLRWRKAIFEKHFPGSEDDAYSFNCSREKQE